MKILHSRVLISLAWLTTINLFKTSLGQKVSEVSVDLTYNMTDFSQEIIIPFGHEVSLDLFSLTRSAESTESLGDLGLEVRVPAGVTTKGNFRSRQLDGNESLPLAFSPVVGVGPATGLFTTTGSTQHLNEVLRSLRFFRNTTVEQNILLTVQYSIFRADNPSKKDTFTQQWNLLKGLKLSVLANRTTFTVYQGEPFSEDLLLVEDNKAIFGSLGIRVHPSATATFCTVQFKDGLVWLAGQPPDSGADPRLDKGNPYRVAFAVRDSVTGVDSESFAFYLQVDSKGLDQMQKLKLVLLTGALLLLVLFLCVCAVLAVRRDKKQMKEEVKIAIQQEQAPENVLTKSILEWNKETSTRDQSHKDSLLFNPYDKYSLKRKHQEQRARADYDQVEGAGSRPDTGRSGGVYSLKGRKEKNHKLEVAEPHKKALAAAFGDDCSHIDSLPSDPRDSQDVHPRLEDIIRQDF
jgi:hypothetical protein